jgi:hypothetical protein
LPKTTNRIYPPALVKPEFEGHPLESEKNTLKSRSILLQSQVRDTVVCMAVAITVVEPTQAPMLQ